MEHERKQMIPRVEAEVTSLKHGGRQKKSKVNSKKEDTLDLRIDRKLKYAALQFCIKYDTSGRVFRRFLANLSVEAVDEKR
ncbi:MAG: hypothetical protein LH631_03235 [Alkalinema sp. CAN_BIN05]|nr:hypothetical protein [Alkalinema sp. CAN_BIN05]